MNSLRSIDRKIELIALFIIVPYFLVLPFSYVFLPQLYWSVLLLFEQSRIFFLLFWIIFSLPLIIIIRLALSRDAAKDKDKCSQFYFLHNNKLIIIGLITLVMGYTGYKYIERSKDELFLRLSEIMKESFMNNEIGYYRDLTNIVCPIVSAGTLREMIKDDYANKRTSYIEKSTDITKTKYDSEWEITIRNGFDVLQLNITINNVTNICEASLHCEPYIF